MYLQGNRKIITTQINCIDSIDTLTSGYQNNCMESLIPRISPYFQYNFELYIFFVHINYTETLYNLCNDYLRKKKKMFLSHFLMNLSNLLHAVFR